MAPGHLLQHLARFATGNGVRQDSSRGMSPAERHGFRKDCDLRASARSFSDQASGAMEIGRLLARLDEHLDQREFEWRTQGWPRRRLRKPPQTKELTGLIR